MYENNVASCRIWDALGFKRVGRVKGAGNLRSYPNELVDAIVYGRDLGPEAEDYVSEERFDKIRYYLKHGKYPQGADRAEKSRLRSAATHYKLLPAEDGDDHEDNERLMLKDKEVVSDPKKQYEIARKIHHEAHGGINKTTATIAEKYHWVRIKETVSLVIKNCNECLKESHLRPQNGRPSKDVVSSTQKKPPTPAPSQQAIDHLVSFSRPSADSPQSPTGSRPQQPPAGQDHGYGAPVAQMRSTEDYSSIPLDPQIMQSQHSNSADMTDGLRQIVEYSRSHPHDADPYVQDTGPHHPDQMNIDPNRNSPHDDTRLATERHVRHGDDPMAYQDSNGSLHHVSDQRSRDAMDTTADGNPAGT